MVTREWRKAKSAKLEFAVVLAFRVNSSFGLNILGPLCLWQCFLNLRGFGSIFYLAMLLQAGLGRLMIPYIHNVEYIKDIFNTEPVM